MSEFDSQATTTFSLTPSPIAPIRLDSADWNFSDAVLRRNLTWFITLRWFVVVILTLLAGLAATPIPTRLGVELGPRWLGSLALVLFLANLGYWFHRRRLKPAAHLAVHVNLWTQITVDLLAVTVVTHYAGSVFTYAPFLYAIHIVLACVFFTTRQSLVVVVMASVFFVGVVILEQTGRLAEYHLFRDFGNIQVSASILALHVGSGILLWISIWLIAARTARILRQREHALIQTQQALAETYRVSQEHMRHTTHQMKAPLDAIRSNISLLREGYAGELPPESLALLAKIDVRAEALADGIKAILDLASLKAGEQVVSKFVELDLKDILAQCIEAVEANARVRDIQIDADLCEVPFRGNPTALRMLFDNLLTNAINYSHDGGCVTVRMITDGAGRIEISDQGIGIPADKIDRIFDEFYRTPEAKQHNRRSTGVGMAIVKHAATLHGIEIQIRSKVGKGTTVVLELPEHPHTPSDGSTAT